MKNLRTFFAVCMWCACAVSGRAQSELNLVAGDGSVTIEWSGLDVTSIEVEGVYDKTLNNPVSPCVITGLENGRLYRFILNRPDANADAVDPLIGTWTPARDEGYEIYGRGERDSWEYDFSPWAAESKMTFLPDGTVFSYDVFGLPDPENTSSWSLDGNVLTIVQQNEDEVYASSFTLLSLTSSGMILESHEIEEESDVDRNGDGVINNDDYYYVEFYQKVTLRKVPLSVTAYAIPGEPFAPQNVQVTPGDGDVAMLNWTLPLIDDRYETLYMTYIFTVNGELSESFYRDEEFAGTAYNLPTDGQPYNFRLIAVRYITPEDGAGRIPVIGKSAPVTVTATGNEDIVAATIYASEGSLHIHTPGDGELKVYTPGGQLYRQQRISAGRTSIPLARGLYFVTFGKRMSKVYVR